jgi:predicted phosphodiesterase
VRYAVLSDIHGNLQALEAAFKAIHRDVVDHIVCLGDIVGYGPEPAACMDLLTKHGSTIIAGNHDFAVANKIDVTTFNVFARESAFWTRDALDEDAINFLAELPLTYEFDNFTAVHGTLHTPELFDYIQTSYDAYLSMEMMRQPLCFIGHSHVPIAFILRDDSIVYSSSTELAVNSEEKTIINVGSVGQPRDKDPRACYALYDSDEETVSLKRVRYNVEDVVARIQEVGLPNPLGERLRVGR